MSLQRAGSLAVPVEGCQVPRILSVPEYKTSAGPDVVELCERVGLVLDPWQQLCLEYGLGERGDGTWASFEVAVNVARQNGKGELLMARELAGLFLLDERLILHSAHFFNTAKMAFERIATLINSTPMLKKRIKRIWTGRGMESVELLSGAKLDFVARQNNQGRGMTTNCVILDEAQVLTEEPMRALLPTLSTNVGRAQIWYAGTAGNQQSTQFGAVRRRGLAGDDPRLTYMEWSVDEADYDPKDPQDWAKANPALGIRIFEEGIESERGSLSAEGFASERLGVGDWPSDGESTDIPMDLWHSLADPRGGGLRDPVCFSVELSVERKFGAICAAGRRDDGVLGVEVIDYRSGVEWVVPRMVELWKSWNPAQVVVDVGGPAGNLIPELEQAGIVVTKPKVSEVAQAAAGLYDGVMAGTFRHMGDARLDVAAKGAKKRPMGDVWKWDRRSAATDISALLATSFALWAAGGGDGELGPDDFYLG